MIFENHILLHQVNAPWRLPKRMTSNIFEGKNKDFDSTVNYSEWTKPQPPELTHVTLTAYSLKKRSLNKR
jgi:hypothetical protein